MFYGDVQVEVEKEMKSQEWVMTELRLSKGETTRRLMHFHYIAWPDFDVPKVPQSLIRFVRTVRARLQGEGGPTIVHCRSVSDTDITLCKVKYGGIKQLYVHVPLCEQVMEINF